MNAWASILLLAPMYSRSLCLNKRLAKQTTGKRSPLDYGYLPWACATDTRVSHV